jgi:adenine deaminase
LIFKPLRMKITGNIVDAIKKKIFKAELLIEGNTIFKINDLGKEDPSLAYLLPGFVDASCSY